MMACSLRLGLTLFGLLWLHSSWAAVPVEEVGSKASTNRGGVAPGPRLAELYYQLQTLQQEVQQLRGLTEEQAHLISRLRKDQKEQYLDLDRRMQGLANNTRVNSRPSSGVSGAAAPRAGNPNPQADQPQLRNGELYVPVAGAASGSNGGSAGDERTAYSAAIAKMKARQFDDSILAFNRLVVDFPGGNYNGHAFYWLGELYLAKGNEDKARQQFVQVIDLFPGHDKVPDALYKIGVVYHRQGDNHRALEYLNRVRAEHAGSNAATLAADYAKEMQ